MLIRFAVTNHLSICESQELSLVASTLKDRRDGLIDCKAVSSKAVLPAIVIYGANASGKSNVLNALETMKNLVLWSHNKGEPGGGIQREVFKLDPACSLAPSIFEIDFVLDGVRHHYGFEANNEEIAAEWLYTYPVSHPRKLFDRDNGVFSFGRELKGQNQNIAGLTRPNSLFLSTAAQNSHEQLSNIYQYFKSITIANSMSVPGARASGRYVRDALDSRVIKFLTAMDTGVVGYRRKKKENSEESQAVHRELDAVFAKLLGVPKNTKPEVGKNNSVELAHLDRNGDIIYFDSDSESAGTRRLLVILSLIFQALDEGSTLCIDQVDARLHTVASAAILKLFCSPATNKKSAQLIATTHDTNLMSSNVLRRDQFWFTEKTAKGATELYPLTEIRTRKGDNIELGYLQGRFGALPSDDSISYEPV